MDQSDADHRGCTGSSLIDTLTGSSGGQSRMRDWLSNILNIITIPEPTLESR